jgi:hypothetical protein
MPLRPLCLVFVCAMMAAPLPAETAPEQDATVREEPDYNGTWLTLGVLLVLFALGGLTKRRINRSAGKVEKAAEAEATS